MFLFDSLTLVSIASFLALWALAAAASPNRDLDGTGRAALGFLLGGTLLAYSAATLPVFFAGWALTIVPFVFHGKDHRNGARLALVASTLLLGIGALLLEQPSGDSGPIAFTCLMTATLLRKGIVPFHFWTIDAFENTSLLPLSLLLNSHLGAYLLIRFTIPLMPETAVHALPFVSALALCTAVFMAVAALAEPVPRRILAMLGVSQASFILAGFENKTQEGITGALLHWWVVAFAMGGLCAVYRALEARSTTVFAPRGYLGFGVHTPRLAVFFAVCGLTLVGLPGTLGFAAEDLLFHGALEASPVLGMALPVATALNAISMFRLFSTLFLGRRASQTTPIPDARLRERVALAGVVLLLIGGGLAPGLLIALRTQSALSLVQLLSRS